MPLRERFRHAPSWGVLPALPLNAKFPRFDTDSSRSYAKCVGSCLHNLDLRAFVAENPALGKISTLWTCLDNQGFHRDLPTMNQHCHGNNRGLAQAYALRNLAAEEAIALHAMPAASLTERLARAKALQSLGALWWNACERIRITRNRPLPGSLRPQPVKKSRPAWKYPAPPTPIAGESLPTPAESPSEPMSTAETTASTGPDLSQSQPTASAEKAAQALPPPPQPEPPRKLVWNTCGVPSPLVIRVQSAK